MTTEAASADTKSPISNAELIALIAMLTATIAFSIDAMLPVLPQIGEELSPEAPNRSQLVLAFFLFGMGAGTLFSGPLSDAYGRHPIAAGGAIIYIASALVAAFATSIEVLLAARLVQGIGASGPRVVAMALVRDLFSGRQMARIMSFIMMVFTLVPVVAPSLGAALAWAFGWRAIFGAFAIFSTISIAWLLLRQPETLAIGKRRPFRLAVILSGILEIARNRRVLVAIAIQSLLFAILFAGLLSCASIFIETYDKEATFPYWFGAIATVSAGGSYLNASIVMRLGMERVAHGALFMQLVASSLALLAFSISIPQAFEFAVFIVWTTSLFFMMGLGIGNLNAIAMEPVGHMAGLGASIIAASATVIGIALASPVGQAFDGTPVPAAIGTLSFTVVALLLFPLLKAPEA